MTSENFVFSGDQRFTVIHLPDSAEWNLKIEYATQKDSGIYECQVNTEPKIKLSVLVEVTGEVEKRKRNRSLVAFSSSFSRLTNATVEEGGKLFFCFVLSSICDWKIKKEEKNASIAN